MSHCASVIVDLGNTSRANSIATPDLSRLRVYYFHHDGEILTEKILHAHRFTHPIFLDAGKHVYHISWSSFVYLLEGIIRKEKDEYFDEEEDDEIDAVELQESV